MKILEVMVLSEKGKLPTRGSENAAGYDLYSAENVIILLFSRSSLSTDIAICVPTKCYGRIALRSALSL